MTIDTISDSAPNGVAVYCASSAGNKPAYLDAAFSVGRAIAQASRPLVYGGGAQGLMGAVSGAALQHGGHAIGVVPYAMVAAGGEKRDGYTVEPDRRKYGEKCETIVVSSMHERKVLMTQRAAGFIALPGGFGTWEEVMEAATWTQLAMHTKPVVILNVLGYYEPIRALLKNALEAGLVQPFNESLLVFVDGPADHSEHSSFDWGAAALSALDGWQRPAQNAFRFDWTLAAPGSDGQPETQTTLQAT